MAYPEIYLLFEKDFNDPDVTRCTPRQLHVRRRDDDDDDDED